MPSGVVRARGGASHAVLAALLDAYPAGLEERGDDEFVVYGERPAIADAEVREEVVPPGWATAYHAHLGPFVHVLLVIAAIVLVVRLLQGRRIL